MYCTSSAFSYTAISSSVMFPPPSLIVILHQNCQRHLRVLVRGADVPATVIIADPLAVPLQRQLYDPPAVQSKDLTCLPGHLHPIVEDVLSNFNAAFMPHPAFLRFCCFPFRN